MNHSLGQSDLSLREVAGARTAARSVAVAVLACALAWGCSDEEPGTAPNVLLISLDACRADHLGSYGYSRDTSPFLDRIAAEGLRFEWAFVNTHGTPPSHTTILSSLYQETHRVQLNDLKTLAHFRIPDGVRLLQEHFRDAGYQTLGVTAGGWMSADFGYSRGFDFFDDRATTIDDGAQRIVELVRQGAGDNRPLFAFLHTYEIHSPYDSPPAYRSLWGEFPSRFEASSKNLQEINNHQLEANDADRRFITSMYDAGIRYTDDVLRVMFSELESLGFFENYIVVITSDHGEELGERGAYLHRKLLFDDLIRVPLILRGSRVPADVVSTELVSSIDIAPTLLAYAGIDVTERMEGRDLLSGEPAVPDAIFSQYGSRRYAIRTKDWKLIINTRRSVAKLYDLRNDPQERENVFARYPETARELESRLLEWRDELPRLNALTSEPDVEITDEQIERLRGLGYVE